MDIQVDLGERAGIVIEANTYMLVGIHMEMLNEGGNDSIAQRTFSIIQHWRSEGERGQSQLQMGF